MLSLIQEVTDGVWMDEKETKMVVILLETHRLKNIIDVGLE